MLLFAMFRCYRQDGKSSATPRSTDQDGLLGGLLILSKRVLGFYSITGTKQFFIKFLHLLSVCQLCLAANSVWLPAGICQLLDACCRDGTQTQ